MLGPLPKPSVLSAGGRSLSPLSPTPPPRHIYNTFIYEYPTEMTTLRVNNKLSPTFLLLRSLLPIQNITFLPWFWKLNMKTFPAKTSLVWKTVCKQFKERYLIVQICRFPIQSFLLCLLTSCVNERSKCSDRHLTGKQLTLTKPILICLPPKWMKKQ